MTDPDQYHRNLVFGEPEVARDRFRIESRSSAQFPNPSHAPQT